MAKDNTCAPWSASHSLLAPGSLYYATLCTTTLPGPHHYPHHTIPCNPHTLSPTHTLSLARLITFMPNTLHAAWAVPTRHGHAAAGHDDATAAGHDAAAAGDDDGGQDEGGEDEGREDEGRPPKRLRFFSLSLCLYVSVSLCLSASLPLCFSVSVSRSLARSLDRSTALLLPTSFSHPLPISLAHDAHPHSPLQGMKGMKMKGHKHKGMKMGFKGFKMGGFKGGFKGFKGGFKGFKGGKW